MLAHQSREAWADLFAADPAEAARRVASLRGAERREAEELLHLSDRLAAGFQPVEPDAAFVHRLGVALKSHPQSGGQAGWFTPRRRWALAAAATVGTVASVAGVVAVWMRHRSQSEVRSPKSEVQEQAR